MPQQPGSPQKLLQEAWVPLFHCRGFLLIPQVSFQLLSGGLDPEDSSVNNPPGRSLTTSYLNWPENDIHVPVDTLKRVHGATAPSGDGEQGLLILKEKTSVTSPALLGPRELMNRAPGRAANCCYYFRLQLLCGPSMTLRNVPTVAVPSKRLWIATGTAQIINSLKT